MDSTYSIPATDASGVRKKSRVKLVSRYGLPIVITAAVFGQPNGVFLYLSAYSNIALGIIVLFVVASLWAVNADGRVSLIKNPLVLPLALFTGLSLISLAYAPDPVFGARILLSVLIKLVLFLMIASVYNQLYSLKVMLKTIVVIGTLLSILGLTLTFAVGVLRMQPSGTFSDINIASGLEYDYKLDSYGFFGFAKSYIQVVSLTIPRLQSTFIEPGYFAFFLEFTIFASLGYLFLSQPNRRVALRFALLCQLLALGFTFSTAGLISTAVGLMGYYFIVSRGKLLMFIRRMAPIIVAACVAGILLVIFAPGLVDALNRELIQSKFETDWGISSGVQRQQSIDTAIELFIQRPILGWGTNQTRIIMEGAGANNILATTAVELGIVGIILYASIIFTVFRVAIKSIRIAQGIKSKSMIFLSAAMLAMILAMSVHGLFIDIAWTFLYWLAVALVFVTNSSLHVMCNHSNQASA